MPSGPDRARRRDQVDPLHRALADLLIAYRDRAELSQRELGERINFTRGSVAGAESCHRIMSEKFWVACDTTLEGGGRLLAAFQQFDRARTRQRRQRQGVHTEIETKPRFAHTSGASRPTRRLLEQDLDPITERHRSLYHALPSDELLPAVTGHLHLADRLLARATDSTRRSLASTVAETAGLAAWLHADLGDIPQMLRLYRMADAAASVSGERALAAYVRGFFALGLAGRGETVRANDQLDAAQRQAGSGSPLLSSWLAAIGGVVAAQLGRKAETFEALRRAERDHDRADGAVTPAWMYRFDAPRLSAYAGSSHLRLGRPVQAISSLQDALVALPAGCGRRRADVTTELARAHLLAGNPDKAARLASIAADAFADWRSAAGLLRIQRFSTELADNGSPAAAKALRDQVEALAALPPSGL